MENTSKNRPPPEDTGPGFISNEELAKKGRKVEKIQKEAIRKRKPDKTYNPNDSNTYLPLDKRYIIDDDDSPSECSGWNVDEMMGHPDVRLAHQAN